MTYLIHDPERTFDEKVCTDADDVRATIEGLDLHPDRFRVVEFYVDEGICRDVTADFQPDEDDEDEDVEVDFHARVLADIRDRDAYRR